MPLRRSACAALWTALAAATLVGCRTSREYQPGPDTHVSRSVIPVPWPTQQPPQVPADSFAPDAIDEAPALPDPNAAPVPRSAPDLPKLESEGRALPLPAPQKSVEEAATKERKTWSARLPSFGKRAPIDITDVEEPVVAQTAPPARRPVSIVVPHEFTPVSDDPFVRRQQSAGREAVVAPDAVVPQRLPLDETSWEPAEPEITETAHSTPSPFGGDFQPIPGTGAKSGVAPQQKIEEILSGQEPLVLPAE
jgi:hypothetical protein